jgi:hypothetical protein
VLIGTLVIVAVAALVVAHRMRQPVPTSMQLGRYGDCVSDVTTDGSTTESEDPTASLTVLAGDRVSAAGRTATYTLARLKVQAGGQVDDSLSTKVVAIRVSGGMPADAGDQYGREGDTVSVALRVSPSLFLSCSAPKAP